MEKFKYFYLRNEKNVPVSCVVTMKLHDGAIAYAVSTHNPADVFSKEMARKVAVGRLETGFNNYHIEPVAGVNVKTQIVEQIAKTKTLPNRARNAAKLWLQ